jgi:hypothetical protein
MKMEQKIHRNTIFLGKMKTNSSPKHLVAVFSAPHHNPETHSWPKITSHTPVMLETLYLYGLTLIGNGLGGNSGWIDPLRRPSHKICFNVCMLNMMCLYYYQPMQTTSR